MDLLIWWLIVCCSCWGWWLQTLPIDVYPSLTVPGGPTRQRPHHSSKSTWCIQLCSHNSYFCCIHILVLFVYDTVAAHTSQDVPDSGLCNVHVFAMREHSIGDSYFRFRLSHWYHEINIHWTRHCWARVIDLHTLFSSRSIVSQHIHRGLSENKWGCSFPF